MLYKKEILKQKHLVLQAIKCSDWDLGQADKELRADKEIVLASVKKYGDNLEYASEKLKNDKEVVLAAIKNFPDSIYFASKELKNDKSVILAAVKKNGVNFNMASQALKDDKDFVLQAINISEVDNEVIRYAGENIKNDKEVVLVSVKKDARTISYVPHFCDDPEVVLTAIKSHGLYFANYTGSKLTNDKDFVLKALKVVKNGKDMIYNSLNETLQNDPDILVLMNKTTNNLMDVSEYARPYFRFPVFISNAINNIIKDSLKMAQNSKEGVLHDLFITLQYAILSQGSCGRSSDITIFQTSIMLPRGAKTFKFKAKMVLLNNGETKPSIVINIQ